MFRVGVGVQRLVWDFTVGLGVQDRFGGQGLTFWFDCQGWRFRGSMFRSWEVQGLGGSGFETLGLEVLWLEVLGLEIRGWKFKVRK